MLFDDADLYYAPPSSDYYQQGDLVLAPCSVLDGHPAGSVVAPQVGRPVRRNYWTAAELRRRTTGEVTLVPAMITTHDCSLDKEFSRQFFELRRAGYAYEAAEELAASDDSLDRFLTVAPVIPLAEAAPSGVPELRANRVVGYFPVCESSDRGQDEGVVDLLRQTTIDRGVIVDRIAILSDEARATLLYALARFWAYRAPKLTYEIEEAIGKRIVDAEVRQAGELMLILTLGDGSELRLLQPPEAAGRGPERPSL